VTLRDLQVIGGEYGIDIDDADDVMLEDVSVVAAELDAIHIRLSEVMIDGCHISSPAGEWVQGIDLSFAAHKQMSMIERCTITGVREGIVLHMAMVDVEHNTINDTTFRGIVMGEMSMGAIRGNTVTGARGVGIYCVDYSECEIEDNTVTRTLVDPDGDPMRGGVAIEAQYFAKAEIRDNVIAASPGGIRAYGGATITRR
jgi:parallel beta-helix repeat protein